MEKIIMVFCLAVTCLLAGGVGGYWLGRKDQPPVSAINCPCKTDVGKTQPINGHNHHNGSPVAGSPGK